TNRWKTNLKKRYNLQIDKNLPIVVADDLLEDKDSPVAPVLQILLTKMWDKVKDQTKPIFTVEMYQNMKREGFLLDDFFKQQTKKLAEWNPELESSGLALDILSYHTTNLGTAGSKTLQEIREHYKHIPEKAELLLYKLKDLYLLVEAGEERTNLTHDTLAPLVRNEYRKSERAGQRASRILENQLSDFQLNSKQVLDELEVEIVEKGKDGMRVWEADEVAFVAASQTARDEKEKARKRRRRYAIAALATILITALFSIYQWNKSSKNADEAKMKELMLLAGRMMENGSEEEKNKALRLAQQASFFAENEENKEKTTVFEDFRKLSEEYRKYHPQGKYWHSPYQVIEYKKAPMSANALQNKMDDPAFTAFRSRTLELSEKSEDMPIFYDTLTEEVAYKSSLDHQNLIIWIKNHSFRIYPYLRGKLTKIIKADSSIIDFFPVDSTHWFVKDNQDQIKAFNAEDKSYKLITKLTTDSTTNINRFQFVQYENQELVVWYDRFLLKIGNKGNTNWDKVQIDTLYELGFGDYYEDLNNNQNSSRIVFSKNLSRFAIYSANKATLFVKEEGDSTYQTLPIKDFTAQWTDAISFSPNLDRVCFANRYDNFSLYDLQLGSEKATLKEVFNKRVGKEGNSIIKIEISSDEAEHILIKLNSEIRIFDSYGNIRDIFNILDNVNFSFSENGKYIIDYRTDKIILQIPIYELDTWVNNTPATELSPKQKIEYHIASLSEQWSIPDTRLEILAQVLSFATILLLLTRYIPILIQLYRQQRYYKIILYGLATLIFAYAVIYREFFTEIEDNFIKQISAFFIILPFYYLLVILFEQRQELAEFIREKNWTSLVLFSAPELLLLSINLYAIIGAVKSDINQGQESIWETIIIILILFLFNTLVLWTIHLSETSFKQGNYIKT
ncbi:MAG: hypothetical protein MUE81_23450, partial [Thermoflexibacter sp.]|nr:hypothetical protein [Thermoflexibacter sp.]